MSYVYAYLIAGLLVLLFVTGVGVFKFGYSMAEARISKAFVYILLWPVVLGELFIDWLNDGESP